MIAINRRTLLTTLAAAGLYCGSAFAQAPGPLPSWSDRPRQSIMDFVGRVTREGGPDYVAPAEGKPEGIDRFIGRRPIFAFGDSDGDWQMLQWTAARGGAPFMGLVHHTDAKREYAYTKLQFNTLDEALDEANAKGWMVVDMKNDWKEIFPFGSK